MLMKPDSKLGVNQIIYRGKSGREGERWGEGGFGNPSKYEIQRSGGHGGTQALLTVSIILS